MARDFKIGGVTPSAVNVGGVAANLISFSNQGYVWARPLSSFTVSFNDSYASSISVNRVSVTEENVTTSISSNYEFVDWFHYNDTVTLIAVPKETENTRETQTVTGTQTVSESVSDSRTTSESISDTRTTSESISDSRTTTGGIEDYRTVTSSTTGYQTVTSTVYRTITSPTYQTGTGSYSITYDGNGSSYGSTSTTTGSSNTRRDGTHYSYQSGTHYSYQSRPGTHYSYQKRTGTRYYYQSRSGTRYYDQSRSGTRYYDQTRSGTRYYDQSRDVYQERTKTRTYSVTGWTGDGTSSTDTLVLTGITSDTIAVTVSGTYSDTYTSWADYDYGDWHTDATRDEWGEWTTYNTRDSWGEWTTYNTRDSWGEWTTNSTSDSWNSWSEYSSEDGNWGSWSEYSSEDKGWSEYSSEDKDWGGWYATSYNSVTVSSCGFIRPLYNFDYWSMGSTSGAAVSPGGSYTGPTTAYAHWSENVVLNSSSYIYGVEDTSDSSVSSLTFYVRTKSFPTGLGTVLSIVFYSSNGTQLWSTNAYSSSERRWTSNYSNNIKSWQTASKMNDCIGSSYAIVTFRVQNGTVYTITVDVSWA